MILGFISLLLTFGQNYIIKICIPTKVANTMLPCAAKEDKLEKGDEGEHHRRLLMYERRFLAAAGGAVSCKEVRTFIWIQNSLAILTWSSKLASIFWKNSQTN